MDERNSEPVRGRGQRLDGFRGMKEMDVVDARYVDLVNPAPEDHGFVDQHPDAEGFERLDHGRAVVVTENPQRPIRDT